MLALTIHPEGVLLPVRAQPGARKTGVQGVHGTALKVSVQAPPQDGRANDALAEVLRKALGLKRSQVALHGGAASRDKVFLLRGVTADEVRAGLAPLIGETA